MTATADQISRDEIFNLLSNARRRYILSYLMEHPTGATIQEISRHIAAKENDIPAEEVTRKAEKRVYVSLYQTHVPQLSEAGVIKQTDDNQLVFDRHARAVTQYLNGPEVDRRPWYRYYLIGVAISIVILVTVMVDIGPFAVIDDEIVTVSILATLSLITGGYVASRLDRRGKAKHL